MGVDTSVNGALTQQNNYMMDGVALVTSEQGSVNNEFHIIGATPGVAGTGGSSTSICP